MAQSKLMELTYYDPGAEVRLTAYADTLILDRQAAGTMLCAVRFGGYPEVTRAMADAIYGGAVVEATVGTETIRLQAMVKRYDDNSVTTASMLLPRFWPMTRNRPARVQRKPKNRPPWNHGSAIYSALPATGSVSLKSWITRPLHR